MPTTSANRTREGLNENASLGTAYADDVTCSQAKALSTLPCLGVQDSLSKASDVARAGLYEISSFLNDKVEILTWLTVQKEVV